MITKKQFDESVYILSVTDMEIYTLVKENQGLSENDLFEKTNIILGTTFNKHVKNLVEEGFLIKKEVDGITYYFDKESLKNESSSFVRLKKTDEIKQSNSLVFYKILNYEGREKNATIWIDKHFEAVAFINFNLFSRNLLLSSFLAKDLESLEITSDNKIIYSLNLRSESLSKNENKKKLLIKALNENIPLNGVYGLNLVTFSGGKKRSFEIDKSEKIFNLVSDLSDLAIRACEKSPKEESVVAEAPTVEKKEDDAITALESDLLRIKSLLDKKLLTDEEFEMLRKSIVKKHMEN